MNTDTSLTSETRHSTGSYVSTTFGNCGKVRNVRQVLSSLHCPFRPGYSEFGITPASPSFPRRFRRRPWRPSNFLPTTSLTHRHIRPFLPSLATSRASSDHSDIERSSYYRHCRGGRIACARPTLVHPVWSRAIPRPPSLEPRRRLATSTRSSPKHTRRARI